MQDTTIITKIYFFICDCNNDVEDFMNWSQKYFEKCKTKSFNDNRKDRSSYKDEWGKAKYDGEKEDGEVNTKEDRQKRKYRDAYRVTLFSNIIIYFSALSVLEYIFLK